MTVILDTIPYPWHERDAVVLHQTLYQIAPRSQRAAYFAALAGINIGLVNLEQPPFDVWYEILNLAATSRKTRALVTTLRADPSLTSAYSFFDALLASNRPLSDRESVGTAFLQKDDQVAVEEAL